MAIKLFLDFLSQPSRALFIFCKVTHIPFELHAVNLRGGEHLTDEFKRDYSQFQKVPFIHDNDFRLSESIAIIRYLSAKHNISSNWYPQSIIERAKIDEYLEWQHHNMREYCALYFRKKWIIPTFVGKETDPKELAKIKAAMSKTIDNFVEFWLMKSPFIGGEKISVADVFAACELEQPRVAGYVATEGRPVLAAWLQRVKSETGPFYTEAHKSVEKLIAKSKM